MSFNHVLREVTKNTTKVVYFWLAMLQVYVLADNSDKGLLLYSQNVSKVHGLETDLNGLAAHALDNVKEETTEPLRGKYEVRSISGEPNFKSVNLTWEVEIVATPIPHNMTIIANNTTGELKPPIAFQILYCELQSFGPQRCRSKSVNSSQKANNKQQHYYTAHIGGLRMSTKYSFHIRPQQSRKRSTRIKGRSEIFENEIGDKTNQTILGGQTIIIPTKGFSAQATKCLPYASEIQVETGPFFGGKIVVDDSSCGIKGDPNDSAETYTMRIDHKLCGSLVKAETNTVETFITVQENLGIFTHSTRRFVVVCSFQSGMQTVRASFTVPGKEGVVAAVENEPFQPDERMGRENKNIQYVNKSALVLKHQEIFEPTILEESIKVNEVQNQSKITQDTTDVANAVAILESILPGKNEQHIKHDIAFGMERMMPVAHARLAKYTSLYADQTEPRHMLNDKSLSRHLTDKSIGHKSQLHYFATNFGSMVITISLSAIMIGVFIYVVLRETRRQALTKANSNHRQPQ